MWSNSNPHCFDHLGTFSERLRVSAAPLEKDEETGEDIEPEGYVKFEPIAPKTVPEEEGAE